jgi:hypothetical protein
MKLTDEGKNPYLAPDVVRTLDITEIIVGLADERITMRMHVTHALPDGSPCAYVGDQLHEPFASNDRRVVLEDAKTFSYRTATDEDDPATIMGEYDLIMASPIGQGLLAMAARQLGIVLENDLINSGAVRVR